MRALRALGQGSGLKRRIVRTARLSIGALLIVAGVISGFLPILQGWVFILAGLTVMAPESHTARRLLEWGKERVARIHKKKAAPGASASQRSAD